MYEEQNIKQLPKDWKWVKFGEACSIIMGQSPPSTSYNTDGIGMPFFQGKAEFTHLHPIAEKWCDAPNKIAEPNDILLSVRAPVGTTNIANQKCCIGRGLAAIRFENYKYAFYFLRSKQQELDNKGTGTTFRAISGEIIRETLFPLPPKKIQKAIVSKIEELFSELEKGIENLRTAQQQLKTYRQSVLKWAFEGKLTNENVKDGELPEGWKEVQIKEVAFVNPKLPNKENIDKNLEIQFLPMKLVEEIINKIHLLETKKFEEVQKGSYTPFIDGDVIFAKVTPCMENGKIAVVENLKNGIGYGSSEFHVIRSSDDVVNKYIFYFLVQDRFRREAENAMTGAVGLRRVPRQFIENYKMPLPLPTEQNQIVQKIESRLSVADKMEENITQSLQQAVALRQSILKNAFEGRLLPAEARSIEAKHAKLVPIERKVLAAKIIHLNHDKRHFGLTKFQKLLYLVENFAEVGYDTDFLKETAGPYDKDFTLAFRNEMKANDWFEEEQKGSITKFIPGDKVGSIISAYAKHFRDKSKNIVFVLQQLQEKNTHDSELIATLYAVWNNRIINKQSVKFSLLVEDFFNWSPKKKEEYQEVEIKQTFDWMKKIKLEPKGFGKLIESKNI